MPGPKWLWGKVGGWARRAAAAVLAAGPVPRHVALCMDGNRRYAQARHMRQVEGHTFGYRRLIDALEWCLELGVRYVSVYAFSIDNYRRCGEEVDTLMALAEEKLAHMLQVGVAGARWAAWVHCRMCRLHSFARRCGASARVTSATRWVLRCFPRTALADTLLARRSMTCW